jgi:plasmid replication initiation protein
VFILLAQIKESDEPNKRYNIRVKDIELITGRKWNYQQVDIATDDLMSRVYKIQEAIGKKKIVLFSEVQYIDGQGSFDIVINEPARYLFFNLKNNFSILELKSVLKLKSKHSKRIYGLVCQWRRTGGHKFALAEFKEMLGLIDPTGKEPEQYSMVSTFKDKILETAKDQINGNTDVIFDYELKKEKGRSFDTIVVYAGVAKPELKQLEIDFHLSPEDLKKIASIMALDISKDMAEKIAINCWKQFVEAKNQTIEDMKNGKPIDHKGKYIIGILQNKGLIEKKSK